MSSYNIIHERVPVEVATCLISSETVGPHTMPEEGDAGFWVEFDVVKEPPPGESTFDAAATAPPATFDGVTPWDLVIGFMRVDGAGPAPQSNGTLMLVLNGDPDSVSVAIPARFETGDRIRVYCNPSAGTWEVDGLRPVDLGGGPQDVNGIYPNPSGPHSLKGKYIFMGDMVHPEVPPGFYAHQGYLSDLCSGRWV